MLRALQFREKQGQRPVEDGSDISVRNAMPKEILGPPQLVLCLAGDGELHFVELRRERLDPRGPCAAVDRQRWRWIVVPPVLEIKDSVTGRVAGVLGTIGGTFWTGSLRIDDGTAGRGRSTAKSLTVI
jgi:hypothetical protein